MIRSNKISKNEIIEQKYLHLRKLRCSRPIRNTSNMENVTANIIGVWGLSNYTDFGRRFIHDQSSMCGLSWSALCAVWWCP